MADNVTSPVPNGTVLAADEIGGVKYPRSKISIGPDGEAVDLSAANPMPVGLKDVLTEGVDRSGTITTGGTAQVVAGSNLVRKALNIQNISNENLWINETGGTATAEAAGSYLVKPGQWFPVSTNRAISIVGASTGSKYTATEV